MHDLAVSSKSVIKKKVSDYWKLLSSTFLWCCSLNCTTVNVQVCGWLKSSSVTIQMKATEQYFPVVLFIMLYMVILTFESVDEILKCDHSNESYWAVLSCGTVYNAVQGGSNFWVCGWNPKVWPFKWTLLSIEQYSVQAVLYGFLYTVSLTIKSKDEILVLILKVCPFKWKLYSEHHLCCSTFLFFSSILQF